MADLYDKLIQVLGLDGVRLDRLAGEPVRPVGVFRGDGQHAAGELRLTQCRLPDGRLQYLFEWAAGDPRMGLIPATPANLSRLRILLAYARAEGPAESGPGSGGWLQRLGRRWVGEDLADLGRLPDESPAMGASLRVRRLPDGSRALVFRFHGRGWVDAVVVASPEHLASLEAEWGAGSSEEGALD